MRGAQAFIEKMNKLSQGATYPSLRDFQDGYAQEYGRGLDLKSEIPTGAETYYILEDKNSAGESSGFVLATQNGEGVSFSRKFGTFFEANTEVQALARAGGNQASVAPADE